MTKDEALDLAQKALEDVCGNRCNAEYNPCFQREAITAIKAVRETKDEPVAVWELFEDGWDSIADPEWMESLPVGTKLYTTPPQQEAKDEPVQVSPLQFVEMVMEKEDCIGKPIIWAEWPNKENT